MGACCGCGFQVDAVEDEIVRQPLEDFHSSKNSMVIQLTEETSEHRIQEVIDMMSRSFAGTTTTSPEGFLNWVQDPNASGDDPSMPLLEDPSEERLEFCRWGIQFPLKMCLPQRSCFALIKEGKVVAAALCLPPSTKSLHTVNPLYAMYLFISNGLPAVMKDKNVRNRMEALANALKESHKKWAPFPHWYVSCFASDAMEQGKGYGREMMEFVTNLADKSGHAIYLETYGPRNERFYSRNGYEVKQRMVIKTENESLEKHGGGIAMVRPAKVGALSSAN